MSRHDAGSEIIIKCKTRSVGGHGGRQHQERRSIHDQIFEEMKELEEKKSKEALLLVQKKAHVDERSE